jgi:hypothetical protein
VNGIMEYGLSLWVCKLGWRAMCHGVQLDSQPAFERDAIVLQYRLEAFPGSGDLVSINLIVDFLTRLTRFPILKR